MAVDFRAQEFPCWLIQEKYYIKLIKQLSINKSTKKFTSIVKIWHQDKVDLSIPISLDGKEEQRSRLVNGFSAIKLRGIEKTGTVPSSLC